MGGRGLHSFYRFPNGPPPPPPPPGRTSTFWNLRSASGRPLRLPACDWGALLNFVGSWTGDGVGEGWLSSCAAVGVPHGMVWVWVG